MFMNIRLSSFITAILLMLLAGSCGKSPETQKAERKAAADKVRADENAAFKIAVTPTMDCLPLFLLADSTLYDTAKVDIRLKQFNAHMDIDTALAGGSVQAAATELVRAVDLHREKHTALRPIAVTPLQWILVGNKKNKITTMQSLGDHMIAMTRYSATDWLTSLVRKRTKTDKKIFGVQINDINVRLKMMLSDEMDAAWMPEPQATEALAKGNVQLMNSEKEGRSFGIIAYREPGDSTADKREAQLQEMRTAYNHAVDLINKRGVRYYSALIKKYTGADDKTIARLPKITYSHTAGPSRADIIAAGKIRFQKHTPKVKIQ